MSARGFADAGRLRERKRECGPDVRRRGAASTRISRASRSWAAPALLDTLLGEIGLTREQCFVANVLVQASRQPRPQPLEIDACKGHLMKQIELIQPRVVCTLGNFATKLLTGRQDGISRVHGTPQVHRLGERVVFLFPIFHPAAALRTPAVREQLEQDFQSLPLLEQQLPDASQLERPVPPPVPEPTPPPIPEPNPPPVPEPMPPAAELVGAGRAHRTRSSWGFACRSLRSRAWPSTKAIPPRAPNAPPGRSPVS